MQRNRKCFLRSLVEELADLVPSSGDAVLIGGGEFHSVDLLQAAQENGWSSSAFLHADTYLRDRKTDAEEIGTQTWKECRALDPEQGSSRSLQGVSIRKEHDFGPVNVVCH